MRAKCSPPRLAGRNHRTALRLTPLEDRTVPAGHTTVETITVDIGNDGVDSLAVVTREFDARDNLLSEVTKADTNGDGTPDFVVRSLTQTFDARGKLTDSVLIQNFDEGVASVVTLHQDFNSRGDLSQAVTTTDFDGDGTVDFITTQNRTYDSQGNLIEQEDLTDGDADGTPDSSVILVQGFNSRGDLTSSVQTFDFGLDGPDQIIAVTNTYNSQGNLTESVSTQDFGGDGVIDFVSTRTQEFDTQGHVTLAVITSGYTDGSGSQVETIAQEFDPHANILHSVDSLDFDNDGVVDIQTTVDRTFDNQGNLLSQVTQFLGDGSTTLTQEFDQHGHLLSSVEVTDFDGDGIPDNMTSLTQEFNVQGELVTSVQSFDLDGNGTADNVITRTFA
jgi:hypothetical protein